METSGIESNWNRGGPKGDKKSRIEIPVTIQDWDFLVIEFQSSPNNSSWRFILTPSLIIYDVYG